MIVYRIAKTDPPTIEDFKSDKGKGLSPRMPERRDPKVYEAISTWDTLKMAEDRARAYGLGSYIAAVDVEANGPMAVYQHSTSGHVALLGPAQVMLNRVISVTRVTP